MYGLETIARLVPPLVPKAWCYWKQQSHLISEVLLNRRYLLKRKELHIPWSPTSSRSSSFSKSSRLCMTRRWPFSLLIIISPVGYKNIPYSPSNDWCESFLYRIMRHQHFHVRYYHTWTNTSSPGCWICWTSVASICANSTEASCKIFSLCSDVHSRHNWLFISFIYE